MHKPRKRFGQNFLHDASVIQRIISVIQPATGQNMVEIGPGEGALTEELLPIVGHLDVVELDRDLVPHLRNTLADKGELVIHQADALKFDFASLSKGKHQLRIIGNLPYNISTPLLFHLLTTSEAIMDMHFMLQKEVVERITAVPGSKVYGRLTVMINYYCESELLFLVKPDSFRPPPKVDSAIVRLVPHNKPPVDVNPNDLSSLVSKAFAQRRKTLRNNLKGILDAEDIQALGIDPGIRPEQLSLKDFASLTRAAYP
jgi:16S rRNA (adenine1518-N6/adenine1519-N6)-dimethyltransferase